MSGLLIRGLWCRDAIALLFGESYTTVPQLAAEEEDWHQAHLCLHQIPLIDRVDQPTKILPLNCQILVDVSRAGLSPLAVEGSTDQGGHRPDAGIETAAELTGDELS